MFGGNGSPPRPAKTGGAAGKAGAKASPTANKGAGVNPEADVKPEPRPSSASTYLADLWSLDLESWTWHQLKPRGQVRVDRRRLHSTCYHRGATHFKVAIGRCDNTIASCDAANNLH